MRMCGRARASEDWIAKPARHLGAGKLVLRTKPGTLLLNARSNGTQQAKEGIAKERWQQQGDAGGYLTA